MNRPCGERALIHEWVLIHERALIQEQAWILEQLLIEVHEVCRKNAIPHTLDKVGKGLTNLLSKLQIHTLENAH